MMNNKAFSLVEVAFVVILGGAIASLALLRFQIAIEKTRSAEGIQVIDTLRVHQNIYTQLHGYGASEISQLDVSIPPADSFSPPDLNGSGDPVAQIERKDSGYMLSIDSDGKQHCQDIKKKICQYLGYKT